MDLSISAREPFLYIANLVTWVLLVALGYLTLFASRSTVQTIKETIAVVKKVSFLFLADVLFVFFGKQDAYARFLGGKYKKEAQLPPRALIVYVHPNPTSHSARILERIVFGLKRSQIPFEILDLYKAEFPCSLTLSDYQAMKSKTTPPQDVLDIQHKIDQSTHLIFVYPVWWNNMPSMLKGFCERVFMSGWAYNFLPMNQILNAMLTLASYIPYAGSIMQYYSAEGKLRGKKALIFRTYGGPSGGKGIFSNTAAGLENCILKFCGIVRFRVEELCNLDNRLYSPEEEARFLDNAEGIAANLINF